MNRKPPTRNHRKRGLTIVEVLVAVIALALLLMLALPALSNARDDARVTQCAANQKQLAGAALKYAADFESKFFYNWYSPVDPHSGKYDRSAQGYWFDEKRIGRYLRSRQEHDGERNAIDTEGVTESRLGYTGGVFVCPADLDNTARSYHMNYWGSGLDRKQIEDLRMRSPVAAKHVTVFPHGTFFDAGSERLANLLLFTDVIAEARLEQGWLPFRRFGATLSPSERFVGPPSTDGTSPYPTPPPWSGFFYISNQVRQRYPVAGIPTQLDYVRHGKNQDRSIAEGAVNIAYADGHVALREHTDLYDPVSKRSTYETLWSNQDKQLEENLARPSGGHGLPWV